MNGSKGTFNLEDYKYWKNTRFNPYMQIDDLQALGEVVVIWGQKARPKP
jgi:hypothetical protein